MIVCINLSLKYLSLNEVYIRCLYPGKKSLRQDEKQKKEPTMMTMHASIA